MQIAPRFLAVAVEGGFFSPVIARQIYRRNRIASRYSHQRVGETAVELKHLTSSQREEILRRLDDYQRAGRLVRDPIQLSLGRYSIRIGLVITLLISATVLVTGIATGWDQVAIGTATGLASLALAVLHYWNPAFLDRLVAWHRLVRVAPVVGALCVTAALAANALMLVNAPAPFNVAAWRLVFITPSVPILLAASWMLAAWRRREVWAGEARLSDLQALTTAHLGADLSTEESRSAHLDRLLRTGVQLLTLNVWVRLVGQVLHWISFRKHNAVPYVVLTYYEPCDHRNESLQVVRYGASEAPECVEKAMGKMWSLYRPSAYDEDRFEKLVKECKISGGRHWRKQLMRQMLRSTCISVPGFVYAKGSAIGASNVERCFAFTRDYASVLDPAERQGEMAQWLNFRSFVAFPVRRPSDCKILGVLVAYRVCEAGLSPDDEDIVFAIANMIGRTLA